MTNQIEMFDRKRKKYRGGGVLGFIVFFIAWIARTLIRMLELELGTLYKGIMIVTLLAIAVMAYFSVRLLIVDRKIRKDPVLKEALYNELVLLNELKAWRIAFFSVIAFMLLTAYFIVADLLKDPMVLVVTAFLVGFGSYNITVYLLDR
ncbi:MAG: hypothetical protein GTN53_33440 [Candidatus Aminicenantes bacterium]|nr:hypothetical protein [Candidatus Aenigmarchaeota archaeon]NIO85459.1 hypothetical protein [Candidatus Aminicenantes bacterium]NIQ71364.1 hypothetical protein [Candidatus Aminicenantes bacterium]NIT27417.1 hypothetical protein [Candidatus Aminicenantes bacterium]